MKERASRLTAGEIFRREMKKGIDHLAREGVEPALVEGSWAMSGLAREWGAADSRRGTGAPHQCGPSETQSQARVSSPMI